jgi:hypothetical protein
MSAARRDSTRYLINSGRRTGQQTEPRLGPVSVKSKQQFPTSTPCNERGRQTVRLLYPIRRLLDVPDECDRSLASLSLHLIEEIYDLPLILAV